MPRSTDAKEVPVTRLGHKLSSNSGSELSVESSNVIIGGQWKVLGRIGEGSFGEVFEAEHIHSGKRYAIKREPLKMRHPQIKHESDIYHTLAGGPGIPQCHWHGQHEKFDCIVIDLLGPNLSQLKKSTKKMSIETIVDLGCQMVSSLEHIHNKGLIYRDVKPDNFLFSADCYLIEPSMIEIPDDHGMPHITYNTLTCEEVFRKWGEPHPKLYVVDFGLTTWWVDPETQKPYPETKKNYKNKIGTARYASLNVHRGKTHSRRDDIEGVGYLILDLLFGALPWTGIQARNSRAGWDRMRQIKEDTFMSDLCAGLPQGFLEFIEYARKLRFAENPNYDLLIRFLRGSINNGEYSSIVKSPFGEHSQRKWIPDIEREVMQNTNSNHPTKEKNEYAHNSNTFRNNSFQNQERNHRNDHHQRQYSNNNNNNNNNNNDNNDAFSFNDMRHTLHQTEHAKQRQHFNHGQELEASPNSRRNHNHNNTPIVNQHTEKDPQSTEPSSFQKLVMQSRQKEKKIGWNSHKHDEAPWIPVIDWETSKKPSDNADNTSWGADQPNAAWGNQDQTPERETEVTWASTVTKPWE